MKHRVGRCAGCRKRRVLGRCESKGGTRDRADHCRGCCIAHKLLRWKPSLAAAVMRIVKSE